MAKHVLLIEDEPNIIEAISFILRQDGWKVSTHSDGTKAVAEIARVAPDLVILDVMLPGRSGFEILQDLRSRAETEKLTGVDADRQGADQGPAGSPRPWGQSLYDQAVFKSGNAGRSARVDCMTAEPKSPYLDVKSYRRKRLIDMARLLPIFGGVLVIFPLPFLFVNGVLTTDATPMALYLFGVWIVLILAAMIFARLLRDPATDD